MNIIVSLVLMNFVPDAVKRVTKTVETPIGRGAMRVISI